MPVVEGGARKAEADGMAERSAVATTRAAVARLRGVMVEIERGVWVGKSDRKSQCERLT